MARLSVSIPGLVLALVACDSDSGAAGRPSASVPGSSSARGATAVESVEVVPCRPDEQGASFTLGTRPARLDDDESSPLLMPHSVELGDVVRAPSGFAVTLLEESNAETHAGVAVVRADASKGTRVDLGRVHGLVVPPRVASTPSGLLLAVADGDVGGTLTRLAHVDRTSHQVAWGSQVPQGNDQSPEFGLAVAGDRALLVWDTVDEESKHGAVVSQAIKSAVAVAEGEPVTLSDAKTEAETPRVVARKGGFWVAWTVNAPLSKKARRHVEADEAPGVLLGPRWIELVRVSARGTAEGGAVTVSPKDGRVLGFDVMALGSGALVVWRDDATSPATPGGRILAARVTADGSVEASLVTEAGVGAGEPILLPRTKPPGGLLVFADEEDRPRIANVSAEGKVSAPALAEGLAPGMPLVVVDGGLVVATPRGRSVELGLYQCALD